MTGLNAEPVAEIYRELADDASVLADPPMLRDFYAWWQGLRAGAEMPKADDVDPLGIPRRVLGYVVLLDVEEGPRFRVRLMGTQAAEQAGRDNTGKYVDEVAGAEGVQTRCETLLRRRIPYFVDAPLSWTDREYKRYRTIVCPLSDAAGARIVRLVSVAVFS